MVFEVLDFSPVFPCCWNFKYLVQKFLIHIKKQGKKKSHCLENCILTFSGYSRLMKMIVHLIRKSNFAHMYKYFHTISGDSTCLPPRYKTVT